MASMKPVDRVHLYTDGGSKGNPGPGAIAVLICTEDNKVVRKFSECIGDTTNNQAEYRALVKGLDLCAEFTRGTVACFTDSQLVAKQMNGEWRLKDEKMRRLFHEVKRNADVFSQVSYQHVRRTNQRITEADKLVKQAHNGQCVNESPTPKGR